MLWLNRQQLATLFGRDYKTISKHINNALKEELADSEVVAKFANTTQHGAMKDKTQSHDILSQNGTICFFTRKGYDHSVCAVYIFLANYLHISKKSCNFAANF